MEVTLIKPHEHAGIAYPPSTVITLDDDLAQWLMDAGVVRAQSMPIITQPVTKPIHRNEEKSK